MTRHGLRSVLWWVLVIVTVLAYAASLPATGTLQNSSLIIPMAGYLVVGALVARRRPANTIGWLFLAIAALSGLLGAANTLMELAVHHPVAGGGIAWWGVVAAWFTNWAWLLLLVLVTFMTFLLYPDGLPSPRWRPVLWAGIALSAVAVVGAALWPTLTVSGLDASDPIDNPVSPESLRSILVDSTAGVAGAMLGALAGVLLVTSVVSLFVRGRHASPLERAQLRWLGFSAVVLVVATVVEGLLPGGDDGVAANLLFTVTLTFLPVSCGIAILRYRLYDIDRVISRTLSYAIVTGLALATYAVLVTSASRLLPSGTSALVVAGATLAAAALVRPLLRRVQRVVDRRFNRERVDGLREVDAFAERLRSEIDSEVVARDMLEVARRTLGPRSAVLWNSGGGS